MMNMDKKQPLRFRNQAFLLFLGRIIPSISMRMVFPFLGVFARGLGVSVTTLSMAIAVREFTGLLAPLLALIGDRAGRKAGMLIGTSVFILSNIFMILWPSYTALFAALCLAAVGANIYLPAMFAYVGDHVPYQTRSRVLALVESGWALSFVLGVPLMGLLIDRYDWQAPFPVLLVMGLIILVLLARFIPAGERSQHTASLSSMWADLQRLFTSPTVVALMLVSLTFGATLQNVSLVFGLWIEDSFGLKIAALGAAASVIGLGDLGGALFCSAISDRLGKERSVYISGILSSIVILLLPLAGRSLWGAVIGLFLFYLTTEFGFTTVLVMFTEAMPLTRSIMVGAGMAAASAGFMLGALLSPRLYAWGGIFYNALAGVGLIILALIALSRVRIGDQEGRVENQAG